MVMIYIFSLSVIREKNKKRWSERVRAMREMLERKIGEEEKRVALGWSKRCSRSV